MLTDSFADLDTRRAIAAQVSACDWSPEFRTLRERFSSLYKAHAGEYVAIVGEKVVGVFREYDQAEQEGMRHAVERGPMIVRLTEDADVPMLLAVHGIIPRVS